MIPESKEKPLARQWWPVPTIPAHPGPRSYPVTDPLYCYALLFRPLLCWCSECNSLKPTDYIAFLDCFLVRREGFNQKLECLGAQVYGVN